MGKGLRELRAWMKDEDWRFDDESWFERVVFSSKLRDDSVSSFDAADRWLNSLLLVSIAKSRCGFVGKWLILGSTGILSKGLYCRADFSGKWRRENSRTHEDTDEHR